MFRGLMRYIALAGSLLKSATGNSGKDASDNHAALPKHYDDRVSYFKNVYYQSYDIVIREFYLSGDKNHAACLIYVSGLVDDSMINNNILSPLMIEMQKLQSRVFDAPSIVREVLVTAQIAVSRNAHTVHNQILSGNTALLLPSSEDILLVNTKTWEGRSIEKPELETSIRGSHEAFTESIGINTALVRRRIKSTDLVIERMVIGRQTNTDVCILYLKNIANDKIVSEVKNRLGRISIDGVLESGYLEAFIEDAPFSPFPTVANTERPDTVAARLLEGRVAIITDGTPMALTVPHLFVETMMITEDYYSRPFYTAVIRFIRLAALLITLILPALYVAIINFHPELLPTRLAISFIIAFEGIPLPAIIEVFMMGLLFEIIREAGIRMPRAVGQAISIVGALIIGEAAIRAGLVGAPIVIITALTALSSFIVTPALDAVTLLRIPFLLAGGVMGLPGIISFLIFVIIHMASIRSFGVPYLSPIAPFAKEDWKDVLIRVPWWAMKNRPRMLFPKQNKRVSDGQKPGPKR